MPGLGNLSHSSSLPLSRCPNLKLLSVDSGDSTDALNPVNLKTLAVNCNWDQGLVHKRVDCNGSGIRILKRVKKGSNGKVLEDYLSDWVQRKMESGLPKSRCFLPFLEGAKKLVECLDCHKLIHPGEEVLCSVRGCKGVYHEICAKESLRMSNQKKFQCPQHVCFVCRQRLQWRCIRCTMASHDKCSPWPDAVIHLEDKPGRAICWRHPTNWRLDKKHAVPATEVEEIFRQLPLPYMDEEFKLDMTWRDLTENKLEPPPYVHIKRSILSIS